MNKPRFSPLEERLQELGQANYERDGVLPVLDRGTAAWNAWRSWRAQNGLPTDFMDRQERWTAPTVYPPVA